MSLHSLKSHSIFLPPSNLPTFEEPGKPIDPSSEAGPSRSSFGSKSSLMVMKGDDLLVAVGKELRITTISGGDSWEVRDGVVGSYKVGFCR